jgi:hypothetical protein
MPGYAEGPVGISEMRYSIRFYYDKEHDVDEEVLFLEQTIKNAGKSTQVFSIYGYGPHLSHIGPKQLLKSASIPYRPGLLRPSKAEDVIRLSPGAEFKVRSWYWADGTFPFSEANKSDMTTYEIPDKTEIKIGLCLPLGETNDVLKSFLRSGEGLVAGNLCSETTRFRYRLLHRSD